MSWIGWTIIGILAANILFVSAMGAVFWMERRRRK